MLLYNSHATTLKRTYRNNNYCRENYDNVDIIAGYIGC